MKRWFIGFLALCTVLTLQLPSWAAVMQQTPAVGGLDDGEITVEALVAMQEMLAQGSKATGQPSPWVWPLSVVPGLGQIMLGDTTKGMTMLMLTALDVSLALSLTTIAAFGVMTPIMGALMPITWALWGLALVMVTWSLVDAYQTNQRVTARGAEIQLAPNLKARRETGSVALQYRALSF